MKLIENGSITTLDGLTEIHHQIMPLDLYLANPMSANKVRIDNDTNLADLESHIENLSLIVIEFNSFTDGRGFSLAYRLRQSLGYTKKLWGSGNLIPDQYAMAVQCGIDGILVDEQQLIRQPVEQWQEALIGTPIPYRYQKALKSNRTVNDSTINYLNLEHKDLPTEALFKHILNSDELGKTAVVSSFGAESAVLLHMLAKFSPDTDVLFVDTGKLFPETLEYQQRLTAALKLANVKIIKPSETSLNKIDPQGSLNSQDSTSCCEVRKVIPLQTALAGYDTWISGRKSYQSEGRSSLQIFERSGSKIKVNPLANWRQDELADYIEQHNLPSHPLVVEGYSSVGCSPCTTPVFNGEDSRGGRWRGQNKTECGIHFINNLTT